MELLQAKAQPNASDNYGWTALHAATSNGSQAVVDLLLKAKADPTAVDVNGSTPAKWAERRGHAGLAQQLRKAEASHEEAGLVKARLGPRFISFAV